MGHKTASTQADKNWSTSTNSQGPDTATQAYIDQIRAAAGRAGGAIPGAVTDAGNFYGKATTAGATGLSALAGDPTATATLMNPYQSQVLDALNAQFDRTGKMNENATASAATSAGAFGGSRAAVAQGVARSNNDLNRNSLFSGVLQGGFNDAMQRAGMLAQGGFQGAGAGANLGMTAGSPDLWLMNILKQGMAGLPYGTQGTSGTTNTGVQYNGSSQFGV